MFEEIEAAGGEAHASVSACVVDASAVASWTSTLAEADFDLDDAGRVDLLRALEELKCAAEGAQAHVTADFDVSQRTRAAERGVPAERQGRGIAEQVALARRESPHRGRGHLRLARLLRRELTCLGAALRAGRITEFTASLVATETGCLGSEDRMIVDATLAGGPARIEAMGVREAAGAARKLVAELDAEAVHERRRRAEADRGVSMRPSPDTMARLSALLPVKDGVSVWAALKAAADHATAAGDPRTRGQVMADTLVERVTGRSSAADGARVDLNLVMTDRALLSGHDEPAHLDGYWPVPADLARELVAQALGAADRVWLRRLYTHPATGELTRTDSRQRLFRANLARLIRLRDQTCRTPWCDAPIRQSDHARGHDDAGPTDQRNGQGLCQACNLAKEAPGWRASPVTGELGHQVETTTPTGHRYRSRAPALVRPLYRESRPGVWSRVA